MLCTDQTFDGRRNKGHKHSAINLKEQAFLSDFCTKSAQLASSAKKKSLKDITPPKQSRKHAVLQTFLGLFNQQVWVSIRFLLGRIPSLFNWQLGSQFFSARQPYTYVCYQEPDTIVTWHHPVFSYFFVYLPSFPSHTTTKKKRRKERQQKGFPKGCSDIVVLFSKPSTMYSRWTMGRVVAWLCPWWLKGASFLLVWNVYWKNIFLFSLTGSIMSNKFFI